MAQLNREIILPNLAEAREQLEALEKEFASASPPSEISFRVGLQHALSHLNFAWNARSAPTERYRHLSETDFEVWGQIPNDLYEDDDD